MSLATYVPGELIPSPWLNPGITQVEEVFWGGERKFLEPLMPLTRGDVRYHIDSSKIDH